MKRIVAYLLVVSLVLLSAPKSLFHSHDEEHEHHVSESSHDDHDELDEDCDICDLDLGFFSIPSLDNNGCSADLPIQLDESIEDRFESEFFAPFQHRGPPSNYRS